MNSLDAPVYSSGKEINIASAADTLCALAYYGYWHKRLLHGSLRLLDLSWNMLHGHSVVNFMQNFSSNRTLLTFLSFAHNSLCSTSLLIFFSAEVGRWWGEKSVALSVHNSILIEKTSAERRIWWSVIRALRQDSELMSQFSRLWIGFQQAYSSDEYWTYSKNLFETDRTFLEFFDHTYKLYIWAAPPTSRTFLSRQDQNYHRHECVDQEYTCYIE